MSDPLTEDLSAVERKQFEILRLRFVAGLSARWLEIRDAREPKSLRSAVHRLAGIAGSYGFERLGQHARDAEALMVSGAAEGLAQALKLLEVEIAAIQSKAGSGGSHGPA